MAAPDPFNSVGGYTVGIPPLPIIAANGDIQTGNVKADNITITSEVRAGGNIYGDTFFGKFAGAISGALTVPGLSTQVLYNTNGNADASPNFTFNGSINQLTVRNGTIQSNTYVLGIVGLNEFSSTTTYRLTTTSTTADQILTTTDSTTVCSLDYTVIATDPVMNRRQTSKIVGTVLNNQVEYYEYGTINVPNGSPGVADFKLAVTGGNVNLTVTPYTSSVNYRIMMTSYKE